MQTIINGKDYLTKEVLEIEHHLHNVERWTGNGGTEDSLTGYTVVSGNGAFGSEIEILSAAQTPIDAGKRYFDLHKLVPLTLSSGTVYLVRIIWGTGTVAAAETAKQYTTIVVTSTGTGSNVRGTAIQFLMKRVAAGTTVWAKCKNATNLANVTFLVGLHEYDE